MKLCTLKKLTRIFVTKKSLSTFYLRLSFFLSWIHPSPHTSLHPSPFRNFVYTHFPLRRLKCCSAWQKLTRLMVLYLTLNKEILRKVCDLKNSIAFNLKISNIISNVICTTAVYRETCLWNFHTINSIWKNYKSYYDAIFMKEP